MANLKSYKDKSSNLEQLPETALIPLAGVRQSVAVGTLLDMTRPVVENVSGADVTLSVTGNREYICGELSSLTLQSVEDSPQVSVIRFTSGVVPTTLTLPETLPVAGWRIPQADMPYAIFILGYTATIVSYE